MRKPAKTDTGRKIEQFPLLAMQTGAWHFIFRNLPVRMFGLLSLKAVYRERLVSLFTGE
jgi:hypothetical protein